MTNRPSAESADGAAGSSDAPDESGESETSPSSVGSDAAAAESDDSSSASSATDSVPVLHSGGAHRRQQAMDESGRIVIAQGLGQCQSLVDGDLVRHIIGEQNLPSGDTQNVAIDHAHTADLPTRGVFVQCHVDLTTVLGHALDDFNGIVGKRGLGTEMCDALVKQERISRLFRRLRTGCSKPFARGGTCHTAAV